METMRRERGAMSRGAIIQMAIIGVAVLAAGYFIYSNFIKSDLNPEEGTHWKCRSCEYDFYVTPARFEEMFEGNEVYMGDKGKHCLECPKCKEKSGYRAYQCPECDHWCTAADEVNGQVVCPKCDTNVDAWIEKQAMEKKEGK
jgi:hypothetical protein